MPRLSRLPMPWYLKVKLANSNAPRRSEFSHHSPATYTPAALDFAHMVAAVVLVQPDVPDLSWVSPPPLVLRSTVAARPAGILCPDETGKHDMRLHARA